MNNENITVEGEALVNIVSENKNVVLYYYNFKLISELEYFHLLILTIKIVLGRLVVIIVKVSTFVLDGLLQI